MKRFYISIISILLLLIFLSCDNNSSSNNNANDNSSSNNNANAESWLDAPSLKEAFVDGGYFDRFGLACELGELSNSSIAAGLKHHANTTTPGNELKPQFIFWYPKPSQYTTFKASNGKTIDVPASINFAAKMDPYLNAAKSAGMQIRGHVLTWHSQTFEWFFTEEYADKVITDSSGKPTNLVDKDTMTARQEWYIKSVLNHVEEWEKANGYGDGNHLIYSWDVVNEAVADDAANNSTEYLRGSTINTKNPISNDYGCTDNGSRWFQIYGDNEFIINAFRFANAYAPSDVTLCYNDYNEYMDYSGEHGAWKTSGIIRLLTDIKNGEAKTVNGELVKPRIDVMGMQSHVGSGWPGADGYENALKRFLEFGIDVQITEFDIATSNADDTTNWKSYFDMLKKYSKKGSEISKYDGHYLTGITIWGINDENSWISNGGSQHPLLFKKSGSDIVTKKCFYSVLNSVK